MNKTIRKFLVFSSGATAITMPVNTKVLTVKVHDNVICLWAMVRPDGEVETREFFVKQDGDDCAEAFFEKYVGTVVYTGRVLHVFEKPVIKEYGS